MAGPEVQLTPEEVGVVRRRLEENAAEREEGAGGMAGAREKSRRLRQERAGRHRELPRIWVLGSRESTPLFTSSAASASRLALRYFVA